MIVTLAFSVRICKSLPWRWMRTMRDKWFKSNQKRKFNNWVHRITILCWNTINQPKGYKIIWEFFEKKNNIIIITINIGLMSLFSQRVRERCTINWIILSKMVYHLKNQIVLGGLSIIMLMIREVNRGITIIAS